MTSLESLGWSSFFEEQIESSADLLSVARVIEEQRAGYRIAGEAGEWQAKVAGRLRHEIAESGGAPPSSFALLPCVGDWVMASLPAGGPEGGDALIHRVLNRRSKFSRRAAGERTTEQVIAANVDTVFLVQSLNRNLNPRRIERYLTLLWESGAELVVVLHKADLCADPAPHVAAVEEAAPGVAVHLTSALATGGLDDLLPYLRPGRTVALVGSSGVGKSTIVNRLAGEELMQVQEIRADDRGRHTTTARRLVLLASGGMLLDTPGMRTILMWEGEEGLSHSFAEVEELASRCRFRDCAHASEPGCAVREALASGTLPDERFASYLKLQREVRHNAMKSDRALRLAEQRRWRQIHMAMRRRPDKRKMR